jgi:hypothetical protein
MEQEALYSQEFAMIPAPGQLNPAHILQAYLFKSLEPAKHPLPPTIFSVDVNYIYKPKPIILYF